jgi:hypothetical protein
MDYGWHYLRCHTRPANQGKGRTLPINKVR